MGPGRASIARLRHGSSYQLLLSRRPARRIALATASRTIHGVVGRGSRWTTPHLYKGARGFATVEDEMRAMRIDGEKESEFRQDLEESVGRRPQRYNRTYYRKAGGSQRESDALDQWASNTSRNLLKYEDGRVAGKQIAGSTPAIEIGRWIPKPIDEQQSSPHLKQLMRALQKRDPVAVSRAFIRWTNDLAIVLKHQNVAYQNNSDSEYMIEFVGEPILREAQALPQSTLSEIFRMMDPVDNPNLDIAHGLRFTSGNIDHIDLNDVMTKFGIRSYHEALHEAILTIVAVRVISPVTQVPGRGSLLPSDFQVAIRCAGMASNSKDASFLWAAMGKPDVFPYRQSSGHIWNEFLRARFFMDPQYHQFDRAKVITHVRQFNSIHDTLPIDLLKVLDRDRFVDNTYRTEPWHHSKHDVADLFSKERAKRHGHGSFPDHFRRQKLYPDAMTQDLLCTAIIGFSRAGMMDVVRDGLMWDYLGIQIYTNDDDHVMTVRGGRNFEASDELRPTEKLLDAVVAGLGSAGHLHLAVRLVDFLSKRYNIPISAAVWSELLQWLYMHTAKRRQDIHNFVQARPKLKQVRRKLGDVEIHHGRAMILEIFKLMTSEPYNMEPSLQDWEVIMKLHSTEESVEAAEHSLHILREKFIPRYDELVEEYKLALADEVLWNSAVTAKRPRRSDESTSKPARDDQADKSRKNLPDPSPERLRLRLQLDHLYNQISQQIVFILKGRYRNDNPSAVQNFERTTIPNIVLEFQRFLPRELHISLRHGSAFLDRHPKERPWWRVQAGRFKQRNILPVKASSYQAKWTREAGIKWTAAEGARIREFRSSPAERSVTGRGVGARMPWEDVGERWKKEGKTASARDNWRDRLCRELYLAS